MIEELRAYAYYVLANVARIQRNSASALDHIQLAITAAHKAALPRLENNLLGFYGGLLFDEGDVDSSYDIRSKSLASALSLGDNYWAAYLMIHLSGNHYIRCEPDEALKKLEQSREFLQQIGDEHGLADLASMVASCLLLRGQFRDARGVIDSLLRQPGIGNRQRMFGYYLNKLAIVQMAEEKVDSAGAQETLGRALKLPIVDRDPMLRFELNTNLAMAKLIGGDPTEAGAVLSGSILLDGLSLWSKLDRRLVEGFMAVRNNQRQTVAEILVDLKRRAVGYKLYRLRMDHLSCAVPDSPAVFPLMMWAPQILSNIEE